MAAHATGVAARVGGVPLGLRYDLASIRSHLAVLSRPVLLLTLAGAAAVAIVGSVLVDELRTGRQDALYDAANRVDLMAATVAAELSRLSSDRPAALDLDAAARALPPPLLHHHVLLVADETGIVRASVPHHPDWLTRPLAAIVGGGAVLSAAGSPFAATLVRRPDGSTALFASRRVRGGSAVAFLPKEAVRAYRDYGSGHAAAFAGTFAGLAGLGAACTFLTRRARSAERDCSRIRHRLDTSLARGRSGILDWDVRAGRMVWSGSLYDVLGYGPETGSLSLDEAALLIHPTDCDLCRLGEDVASGAVTQVDRDLRIRTAGGEWLPMRIRAAVIVDPQDGGLHLVGIVVDVTDERDALERHAEADMRLRDAIEAISEAFVLWDADNRLVLCNSKFRELHALPHEAVRPGIPYGQIMDASDPSLVEYHLTRDDAGGSGARTLEARLSDGRWLHINERRTRDGGYVSVGTDITALKRQEERLLVSEGKLLGSIGDLKRSRQTLERQKQQLADLAERYHDQKAQAEHANRAKTDFLAKMSHELRTPLNAILGFAEVMRGEMLGPIGLARYCEYADDIHRSGRFLLGVIDDILQMSWIETGTLRLRAETVLIADIAAEAGEALREPAERKDVAVALDVPEAAALRADADAVRQIVANLLGNAVKFSLRGGHVRLRARPAAGGVNLFVADDGVGIPAAFLGRLGRPFEQVEPEFTRATGGSGLGLAISRSLAEMHGGSLRIRSRQGTGTLVMVHLPADGLRRLAAGTEDASTHRRDRLAA